MNTNRFKELVLKADDGITFKVSEGENNQIIIRALNHFAKGSTYCDSFTTPYIPEGYEYVYGNWSDGFVIRRKTDKSEFVWVPVASLISNGTLDGDLFTEKFGRRNYIGYTFSDAGYHEKLEGELLEQFESVKKYGGFYISRYNISKGSAGKPVSIKGAKPWVNIEFAKAKELAASLENSDTVSSHLTYGAEYDSVLEWFINSNARTVSELVNDSTKWGFYSSPKLLPPYNMPEWEKITILETGSSETYCTNNIYDFAGNVAEWTQEQHGESWEELGFDNRVVRGNYYEFPISENPVFFRNCTTKFKYIGFRVVLCIK